MQPTIYTIGHSNHTTEHVLSLLSEHKITALCDVRSIPHSRYNPQFNKDELKLSLNAAGIVYVFLGKELGARSDDPSCYLDGKIQFSRLACTDLFQRGLKRLAEGAIDYRIAIMCAEKEPLDCHRAILVARELVAAGFQVQHIHADGGLEDHVDALHRLAHRLRLREAEQHLFRSEEDLIDDAYMLQERRIAYDSASENRPE